MRRAFLKTIALGALLTLTGVQVGAADKLRVGVEGAYPPFSWKESDGTLKGFDIDMANEVCKRLGRECVLVEQEWDGMIPALLARKFDVIIASMSITEERKKKVDFTVKYYNTPAMLVAKKNPGFEGTAAGLKGKRIGVQRATTHQCYAEKFFKDSEIVLYATQEEVFQDLAAGRLDAQLSDSLQAMEGFLSKDAGKGYAYLGGARDDLTCFGEGAGFALRKKDSALRDQLSETIKAIRADGTYQKMNDKYFKIDIYGS
ncbi:MAG: transporter substrate-binding domain-containing protein [Pseudomonadota bacterium]